MDRKRKAILQEKEDAEKEEAEKEEAEKAREAQEGSAADDDTAAVAAKTKKPNGFDMFSDDVDMFAEAHSVSMACNCNQNLPCCVGFHYLVNVRSYIHLAYNLYSVYCAI